MKSTITSLLLTAMAIGRVCAQAPDPDTTARHFIIMVSIANLQEINASKLAAQKAMRPDVKAFAEMMVADHTQLERKLLELARTRGYQMPVAATDTPPQDPQLAKAKGDDLDRLYIHNQVPDHASTVNRFKTYAISGQDEELKEFARQALPMLKKHLDAINALNEKYKTLSAK